MKWYQEKFRHHLLDMHINDWSPDFLSEFDPEKYVENLKRGKINAPMIYLQSHVGLCYWPTKSGKTHRHFAEHPEQIGRLIDLCHQENMAVIGYYSLIYNTVEHDRHPDWKLIGSDGKSVRDRDSKYRYGHCCPNNPDYRTFLSTQIREMSETFKMEGMFYDMPFWPQTCYCPSCRKRWAEEVGGEMPTVDKSRDPAWCTLMAKAEEWMTDFCAFVRLETEKYMPWIQSVEFNYASPVSSPLGWPNGEGEGVGDLCDFANGDLYGGNLQQSVACKYYAAVSRNEPFEYMTSRCNPGLWLHTVNHTQDQLTLKTLITTAHHGATMVIDAIDPVGTMDSRVYDLIGKAYAVSEPYEKYFEGKLKSDVAVLYNVSNKRDRENRGISGCTAAVDAALNLISSHLPTTVISRRQMDSLSDYPLVMIPLADFLQPEDVVRLKAYVEQGGCLYFSGAEESSLLKIFFDASRKEYTVHNRTYMIPKKGLEDTFNGFNEKYPLPFEMSMPVVEGINPEFVLATIGLPYTARSEERFASIHSDPPGIKTDIPAMAYRTYGKGKVLWCAVPLEAQKVRPYRMILQNLLRPMLPETWITSDAPEDVELLVHEIGNVLRVGAVQLTNADTVKKEYPFEIRIRTEDPCRVTLQPDGQPVSSRYEDGQTVFTVDGLRFYHLYELTPEKQ